MNLFTHCYRSLATPIVSCIQLCLCWSNKVWNASLPNTLQYVVWTNQAMLIANSSGIDYCIMTSVYSLFHSLTTNGSQFCGSPLDQTSSAPLKNLSPFDLFSRHSMIFSGLPMQRHHFSRIPHHTCWNPPYDEVDLMDGRNPSTPRLKNSWELWSKMHCSKINSQVFHVPHLNKKNIKLSTLRSTATLGHIWDTIS